MLDKKMTTVLGMLAEQVGYSYKVVKKQQLIAALPKKCKIDAETFLSIVSFLKENDYLVVKYQDKEEICLSLTVKAETYLAGEKDVAVKSKITGGQVWLLFFGVFLASLLGALVAEIIGKLF